MLEQRRRLVTQIPGPQSQALLTRRQEAVSAGVGMAVPVFVAQGQGGILRDVDGNQLIDLGSGIAVTSVGVSDPGVVRAVSAQAERVSHTCFMVTGYEPYVALCERLNDLVPGDGAKKTVLFNSGAEAVENAVKIARVATGRHQVAAVEHAYHGRTSLTMALTAKAMPFKRGFGPFTPGVVRVPTSYPLKDGLGGPEAAARTITRLETEIGADDLAALIIEPIQGEGGFVVPAPGFLPTLANWCRSNGVLFIADEVQTGFCRTGDWFACEHEGVVPDLITLAKGIADGFPISAVTGSAELMDAVHVGGLGGTYGGNPVSCAAALATIDKMARDDLSAEARRIEATVRELLTPLLELHYVAELRGRGAMLALELIDARSGEHLTDLAKSVAAQCARHGVVVLTAGTQGNVIRLLPPLVIDDELLREGLSVLVEVLREQELS